MGNDGFYSMDSPQNEKSCSKSSSLTPLFHTHTHNTQIVLSSSHTQYCYSHTFIICTVKHRVQMHLTAEPHVLYEFQYIKREQQLHTFIRFSFNELNSAYKKIIVLLALVSLFLFTIVGKCMCRK